MSTQAPPRPSAPRPSGNGNGNGGGGGRGSSPNRPGDRSVSDHSRFVRRVRATTLWPLTLALVALFLVAISGLAPVIEGIDWWFEPALVGIVVLVGAQIIRLAGAPRWVASVGAAVIWLASIVVLFAAGDSILFVIPTPASIDTISSLANAGAASINSQATPATLDIGIQFLLVVGAGLFAVLFDVVAFTGRMPAVVGVPVIGLAIVPGIFTGDVDLWSFSLCAVFYVLVLWADAGARRLARRSFGSVAAVGAAAIVVALIATLNVPGFNGASLVPSSGGVRIGGGVSPLIDLGKDLRQPGTSEAFRYSTTSQDRQYFRLLTLDQFDGTTWSSSNSDRTERNDDDTTIDIPGLGPDIATTEATTRVEIETMESPWLPVPFPSTEVSDLRGTWMWDVEGLTLSSRISSTRDQTYTATSQNIEPTPEQLAEASAGFPEDVSRFLELPDDVPGAIQDAANQATEGDTTAYERAVDLQQYFRSGDFLYSESAPVDEGYDGDGFDVIAQFLEKKSGYCVHYASAMAIMARLEGIPARVSLGYLPGTRSGASGDEISYSVSSDDLHSWPELYFEGVGWVPFEPTPSRGEVPDYAIPESTSSTSSAAPVDPQQQNGQQSTPTPSATAPTDTSVAESADDTTPPATAPLLALLLLVLAAVPGTVRAVRRRRRLGRLRSGAASADVAWLEISETARDLGLSVSDAATPRQIAESLSTEVPFAPLESARLTQLLEAVERLRFAGDRASGPPEGVSLEQATTTVLDALARSRPSGRRILAAALPASVLTPSARREQTPADAR